MGHWKRLITIPGGTDCYYCINNMTCLIQVSYCVVVLVTVSVILSTIMLPVDFATLPDAYYTSCRDTRIPCIAYILFSVYLADIMTIYTQHCIMVILHMPICMFTSITSPLDNLIYYLNWIRLKT